MALSGRELLLIVRAQNQASGALRRVSGDMARLAGIRDLHYKQNQLLINQGQIQAQRQNALNRLNSISEVTGKRNIALQRAKVNQARAEVNALLQVALAEMRLARARKMSAPPEIMQHYERRLQSARLAQDSVAISARHLTAREAELAAQADLIANHQLPILNQRLAQNAAQQREVAKAINNQRWERISAGGRIMTHVGRVMQLGGLVAGGALAYMASVAAKFNTEVTLAATQTGKLGSGAPQIARNSKVIEKALLGIMTQSTATRQELTQSMYDIYSSLNVSLGGGTKLLRLFSKASIAGLTPLNEVTQHGITIMNDFKLGVGDMGRVLQRSFAAVRFGRMTFQQFTMSMNQLVPAFAAAGQTFDSMAGAMAFMTRMMPSQRMAATGLARLMEILGRKDFVQGAKTLGVNITNTHGRLLPLIDVIDKLVARFPRLRQGGTFLQNFFKMVTAATGGRGLQGTIQARRAFTFLVENLQQYHHIQRQVVRDNNEFSRSFAAMSQTAGVRWSIFVNRLRALAITIGAAVIPALLKLTEPLQHLVEWFTKLDDKTKAQIGRYAAFAAAFLLVGGTVMAVVGMLATFVAALGRLGIAGIGTIAIILSIVTAAKFLTGQWHSLSDVVSGFADTMIGSWKGFLAMSALIVVAVLKIASAFRTMAIAEAAAGAAGTAGGLGGLLGGIGRAASYGRFAGQYAREAEGAGRLMAGLKGAAAAAVALPGPLKIAAAAIGLGAGLAYLWQRSMEGARREAEKLAKFHQAAGIITGAVPRAATTATGFGAATRDLIEQRNVVKDLNVQVNAAKKAWQGAAAAQKPALHRQYTNLLIQQSQALEELTTRSHAVSRASSAFGTAIKDQSMILGTLGPLRRRRQELMAQLATWRKLGEGPSLEGLVRWHREIDRVNFLLKQLGPSAVSNAAEINRAFRTSIRVFQQLQLIPQKISPGAQQAALRVAVGRGRMLTPQEVRTVIKAYVDPASLRKAPADIRRAVAAVKATIIVQTRLAKSPEHKALSKVAKILQPIGTQLVGMKPPQVHQSIKNAFRIIHQQIHIDKPSPDSVSVGVDIANGIAAGVYAGGGNVNTAVVSIVNSAIAAGRGAKGAKAHSPSLKTRDLIGIPLMQGIIVGIEMMYGNLQKASTVAIDFFAGPWITFLRDHQGEVSKATIGSAAAIARLTNHIHALRKAAKGVTPEIIMLERQLHRLKQHRRISHEIGLADLTKDLVAQLHQLRVYNSAMAVLAKRGVPLLLLNQLSQLGVAGAKFIAMLANSTKKQLARYVAIWTAAMREVNRSARFPIDQIYQNLHDSTETAARFLLDKWNSIKDSLVGIFGGIGEGWSKTIDVGGGWTVAGPTPLAAIQQQIQKMQHFKDVIDNLRKRGVPPSILAEILTMGPSAIDYADALNQMSDIDLASYVNFMKQYSTVINDLTQGFFDDQIAMWRAHGAAIAAAIMAGIMDEQEPLLAFFRKMFENLLGAAKKEVIVPRHPRPRHPHSAGGDRTAQGWMVNGVSPSPTINMTVNAHHSESLMSQLERATFRLRNRTV